MSERVTMPALGESVTEGTVTRWLKSVGETVAVDEPLLEVSTDKVDTEIPSPVAGTLLEILAEEDDTVPVGSDLAVVGSPNEAAAPAPAEPAPAAAEPAPAAAEPAPAAAPAEPAPAAPAAPAADATPAAASGPVTGGEPIAMPALGESVTEGTITRWLKAEGDHVDVDEPLVEVSTDKVDTEVPSPIAGILTSIVVQEDETVPVGATLAIVGGSASAPAPAAAAEPAPSAAPAAPVPAAQAPAAAPAAPAPAAQAPKPAPTPQPTAPVTPAPAAAPVAAQPAAPDAKDEPAAAPSRPAASAAPATTTAPSTPTPKSAPEPTRATPAKAEAPSRSDADEEAPGAVALADGDAATYVTPLVRKLANDLGVDLDTLSGSGIGGRIRKQDVLAAAGQAPAPTRSASASLADGDSTPATEAAKPPSHAAPPSAPAVTVDARRGTTETMSRLRQTIAKRMVESLQVSAQLTSVVEVDVTKIAQLRQQHKAEFRRREGTNLSFLPFFAQAACEALKAYPTLNASIDGKEVTYHSAEDLGIAVDTDKGLLVPVVKDAGSLNIAGLARAIADLAERTRTNKITPDDLDGATFTLTNTGSRGALFDTPIINQPQVAILGTGAVVKRPVVVTDDVSGETIAIRSMVYLALSYDHRLVDGADAARFLTAVKNRLEDGRFDL